jgi:uncharacterized CHY-type Zn-finger protein
MELKEPESMNELVYFSNRDNGKFKARAWVFKEICPKCKKGLMSKPINEKTGRPKIRAKEYVCPECGYTVDKQEYEDSLTCNIEYTCPECSHEGKTRVPYKRKTYFGVKAIVFHCDNCNHKLGITKKLKAPKKKKKKK